MSCKKIFLLENCKIKTLLKNNYYIYIHITMKLLCPLYGEKPHKILVVAQYLDIELEYENIHLDSLDSTEILNK